MDAVIKYFLPLVYGILILWLIGRNRWLRTEGLKPAGALAFTFAKMATGMVYTFIMIRYIPSAKADIDLFFGDGLEMYQRFWQDPAGFPSYLADVFTITDFRIGETDSDFIRTVFDGIKFIHFLLDFLSGGHIYTNVLLFNGLASFLFLRCWVYLRKIFAHPWLGFWMFLFPSAFFFTSVVLKEGIELCLIAAIIPALYKLNENARPVRFLGILVLFFLLFFFKYLIAATFIMLLFIYFFLKRFPKWAILKVSVFFGLLTLVFFGADKLVPALNLPNYIVERRIEFLALDANTELNMKKLEPTFSGFAEVFPEAVFNVLFRPVPGEVVKPFYYLFLAELYALWLFILFVIVHFLKKLRLLSPTPEAVALLIFGIVNLLIIGYTITNTGAIIRYRSIFLPCIGYFFFNLLLVYPSFFSKNRFLSMLSSLFFRAKNP
ncbi:MAG: hypothetical protein MUE99_07935 [Chitinophagaceae bacterium]|nr:hypothetical protein [Chitinophagaceae bacterium]